MRTLISSARTPISSRRALVNANMVRNGNMEVFPASATPTSNVRKWIDGTGGGSSTNDAYGWAIAGLLTGSGTGASFDPTVTYNGRPTLKLSVGAVNSALIVSSVAPYDSASAIAKYGILLPIDFFYSNFVVSYKMKTELVSGAANTGACGGLTTFNGSGQNQGSFFAPGVTTTTDWTEYSYAFQIQTNLSRYMEAYLQIKGNDGAATLIMNAWFADFRITRSRDYTRFYA